MISKIVKALMLKNNVNTSELARRVKVPQQTLQRIVSGSSTSPRNKTLQKLADYFDIDLSQLRGDKPLPERIFSDTLPVIEKSAATPVPVIGWDSVCEFLTDPKPFSEVEHVYSQNTSNHNLFAVLLEDSSMEPYFPKGALLLMNANKEVKDRSFVLVKLAKVESLVFRELIIDAEYHYLKSLNPELAKFPMRVLEGDDEILAVMVELRHRFD